MWIGLLFSVACLALSFYGIDLEEVSGALRGTNVAWLAGGVLLILISSVVKAARWRLLFKVEATSSAAPGQVTEVVPSGEAKRKPNFGDDNHSRAGAPEPGHRSEQGPFPIGLARLTNIWMAGAGLNLALPAPRSGDVARAYLAGEAGGISKSWVLGTVAAEKLLDVVMLAACLLALVPFMVLPDELAARQLPLVGLALFLILLVFIVLWQQQRLLALAQRILRWLPARWSGPLIGSTERAVRGLAALRYPGLLSRLLLWSVLVWAISAAVNYTVFLALGLPASWVNSFFVLVVLQAGVAVPSSPGKIGVFQVLSRWALTYLGYSASAGLAYGILLYLVAPVAHMVLGGLALLWESWQFRQTPLSLGSLLGPGAEPSRDPLQSKP